MEVEKLEEGAVSPLEPQSGHQQKWWAFTPGVLETPLCSYSLALSPLRFDHSEGCRRVCVWRGWVGGGVETSFPGQSDLGWLR